MRGHKVSLYEKNEKLGGNLIPGGSHSFKKEVRELNAWYQNELSGLPVEIHTGQAMTAEQLRDMGADVIILATGSVPVTPKVPGMDDAKVLGCMDAFAHTSALVKKFTEGAESVGNTATEFFLDKMNINGCKGCFGGRSSRECKYHLFEKRS